MYATMTMSKMSRTTSPKGRAEKRWSSPSGMMRAPLAVGRRVATAAAHGGAFDGAGDAQGLPRRGDVVHAHDPRPARDARERRGDRAAEAIVGRRQRLALG